MIIEMTKVLAEEGDMDVTAFCYDEDRSMVECEVDLMELFGSFGDRINPQRLALGLGSEV